MKTAQYRYRDDLSSLSASTRRACYRCAGRPLSQRSMRAPVVEIADILGQDLLQMAQLTSAQAASETRKTPRRTPPCALTGSVILSTAWVRFDERRGGRRAMRRG